MTAKIGAAIGKSLTFYPISDRKRASDDRRTARQTPWPMPPFRCGEPFAKGTFATVTDKRRRIPRTKADLLRSLGPRNAESVSLIS